MADARFHWGAWLGAMGLALAATPAAAQGQPAQVTFTKDVAPIFQKACESCHRKDSLGPMSLVTYEEALRWASNVDEFKLKVQGIHTTSDMARDQMARAGQSSGGKMPEITRFGG